MREGEELDPLVTMIDDLAANVASGERRRLAARIATDLRTANAKRIRANVMPKGEPMPPRRRLRDSVAEGRRIRKPDRMFQKAASTKWLRKWSNSNQARIGFVGLAARIMRVHHLGLRDSVSPDPGAPQVTYDERTILGLSDEDRERILDRTMTQLAGV